MLLLKRIARRVEELAAAHALALEDDERDPFGRGNLARRIAVDEEEVRVVSRRDAADALLFAQQLRRVPRSRLQRDRWRNAGLDPQLELALHGRTVHDERVARVAAGDERHAGAPRADQIVA